MIHTETVHASQLKRAMSNLSRRGVDIQGYGPHPDGGNMMTIVILLPDNTAAPDWREPVAPEPKRRRLALPDVDLRSIIKWLCVLVIVGGVCYLGYTMFSGGTFPTLGEMMGQVEGEPIVERTGFRWPWESETVSAPKAQPQGDGFQWPWQSATNAVADVAQGITNGLMLVGALLVIGVGLWVVGKARGGIK